MKSCHSDPLNWSFRSCPTVGFDHMEPKRSLFSTVSNALSTSSVSSSNPPSRNRWSNVQASFLQTITPSAVWGRATGEVFEKYVTRATESVVGFTNPPLRGFALRTMYWKTWNAYIHLVVVLLESAPIFQLSNDTTLDTRQPTANPPL